MQQLIALFEVLGSQLGEHVVVEIKEWQSRYYDQTLLEIAARQIGIALLAEVDKAPVVAAIVAHGRRTV